MIYVPFLEKLKEKEQQKQEFAEDLVWNAEKGRLCDYSAINMERPELIF